MPAPGPVGGHHGGSKPKAKKVVKKAAGPPNFPKLIPVRPGAPTPRGATKPSTQAQRTHVHKARVHRAKTVVKAQALHDVPTDADLATAQAFNKAHPVKHEGLTIDTSTPEGRDLLKKGRKNVAKAQAGGALGELTGLNIKKALNNIPSDTAEIAVTTPSSIAKLASTAVHDPKKVPGMLAQPYKDLIKDPKGFIEERPVSAALMIQPAARIPGRVVGRAARVAGKQTLTRPAATLPGTALKEARTGSRDFTVRRIQARKDAKNPNPTMTDAQIEKRADEFYDRSQQQKARVVESASTSMTGKRVPVRGGKVERQALRAKRKEFKAVPKDERTAALTEHVKGARGGAKEHSEKRFAEEFGSNWVRTPEGTVLKPKQASKGVLHDNKADADLIAERVPFDAKVKQVGEKYAVVPRVAAERLYGGGKNTIPHATVGTSPAMGAKVMRTAGKSFRAAVLPLSAKWLTGQGVEAGIRSAVEGAGPMSLLREHRNFKAMEAQKPGSGVEFRQNTSGGGQFGLTGTAREFADGGKTLAEEFEGTSLGKPAKGLTKAGAVPPVKAVRAGFRAYSRVVFDVVNGAIETTAQRAMTGKAIKKSPLMERKILGLTDRAIQDAARGLQATENQVALGRAVIRAYGQYSKFSPTKRETLLHTTPFYPWYRNVVTFLTKTLPVDHPVTTALLADLDAATEEWRKAHGLSFKGGKRRPDFLLGGYPAGGDKIKRVGRYTPFSPGDPVGSIGDLALPQFAGIRDNIIGIDFTGKPIKGNRLLNAGATALETHVPGVAPAGRVTGLTGRYVRKKDEQSVLQGKDLAEALKREVNPLMATKSGGKKSKRKTARKEHDILGAPGGGTVDILK